VKCQINEFTFNFPHKGSFLQGFLLDFDSFVLKFRFDDLHFLLSHIISVFVDDESEKVWILAENHFDLLVNLYKVSFCYFENRNIGAGEELIEFVSHSLGNEDVSFFCQFGSASILLVKFDVATGFELCSAGLPTGDIIFFEILKQGFVDLPLIGIEVLGIHHI
jgi:hypothetical protein